VPLTLIAADGGSGIGRAGAIRFAPEGAAVLVVGRSANAGDAAAEIRDEGGTARAMIAHASIEAYVAPMVDRRLSEFGGLEILFADSGITGSNRHCSIEPSRSGRKSIA
jgi:NAD(P)-dependent dehydrogenase (short-subunit alcohol dehydrogenase family)